METRDVEVPITIPGLPGVTIDHVTVPLPSDVNPTYPIDQHTTAYADPQTLAFRNLVSIVIGDRGEVVPAP